MIFLGTKWAKLKRKFKQIDTRKTTWAVDVSNTIYGLNKGKWKTIPGKLNHVSSGVSGVWGIMGNSIWYRVGVSRKLPLGRTWKRIPGGLKQIDSGPNGIVCGVNSGKNIYCRTEISRYTPYGKRWMLVPGKLKYISCGDYGHWGVGPYNKIWFRQGVSRLRPQGFRWKRVAGRLTQVDSGQYGQVVGVNKKGQMYVRTGITEQRPFGRRWKKVSGVKLFTHASVGRGVVFGVDSFKNVYRGTIAAVGGKNIPVSTNVTFQIQQ